MNCKVLIHEATFEDALEQDAKNKKHTCTGQAIALGQRCKAWRIILTHFSPRYAKIAEVSEEHL
jgi:ribonuclease Z